MKKISTIVIPIFIIVVILISCLKEKKVTQDFCGEKIISKDTSSDNINLHFRDYLGSENTLTLSKQFNFYDSGMIFRCDTLMK